MPSDQEISAKPISVNVELAGPEWRLQATMSVPTEPVGLNEMLPMARLENPLPSKTKIRWVPLILAL